MSKKHFLLFLVAVSLLMTAKTNAQTSQTCSGSLTVTLTGSASGTALAAPTADSATQHYCSGTLLSTLKAVATSGATINWYATSSVGSALSTSSVLTAGDYYASQTLTSTSCESVNRVKVTVVINAATAISTQPTDATPVCINGAASLTVAATGINLTYQWYDNGTTNSNTGGFVISGATSSTYSALTTTAGVKYYYVIVSGFCGSAITSAAVKVTVNAATAITTSPVNQTVCLNGTVTALTAAATGSGIISYQWYSNTTNSTSGSTAISTATTSTYALSSTTAGIYYYYVVATSSSCGTATSSVAIFTVNALPIAGTCTAANDACQVSAGAIKVTITVAGSNTYTLAGTSSTVSPSPTVGTITTLTNPSPITASGIITYDFTSLPGNAQYKFKIIDSNGCVVGATH